MSEISPLVLRDAETTTPEIRKTLPLKLVLEAMTEGRQGLYPTSTLPPRRCEWSECGVIFIPTVERQRFHHPNCRQHAIRQKKKERRWNGSEEAP
jgi:hypothetical protein